MEVQVQLTPNEILKFQGKVDRRQPDECWPWTGTRNDKGYGRARARGRQYPAAQIAWSIQNGVMFPVGKMACHSCDNPPCCNPKHIWVGTHDDNMADAAAKGRFIGAAARFGGKFGKRERTSHCPKGHARTPENTFSHDGQQRCKLCKKAAYERRQEQRRAEDSALPVLRATLIEIAGNGDGSGRNPQLMVDAAVAALAKIAL
jgi:hypothetical protein